MKDSIQIDRLIELMQEADYPNTVEKDHPGRQKLCANTESKFNTISITEAVRKEWQSYYYFATTYYVERPYRSSGHYTILGIAILNNYLPLVKSLIETIGIDPCAPCVSLANNGNCSPYATPCTRVFSLGHKVNCNPYVKENAIHFASFLKRHEILHYLLSLPKTKLNDTDTLGSTLFHNAVYQKNQDISHSIRILETLSYYFVERRLNIKVIINAKNNNGHTALDVAWTNLHSDEGIEWLKVIEWLIEAGAKPTLTTLYGKKTKIEDVSVFIKNRENVDKYLRGFQELQEGFPEQWNDKIVTTFQRLRGTEIGEFFRYLLTGTSATFQKCILPSFKQRLMLSMGRISPDLKKQFSFEERIRTLPIEMKTRILVFFYKNHLQQENNLDVRITDLEKLFAFHLKKSEIRQNLDSIISRLTLN